MEVARRLIGPVADGSVYPLEEIWRDFKTVLSYLWEGRPALAEQIARPKHSRWEAEVGRRGPWAALIGSVLAGACWQQDMRSDAKALLAGRLDVIEQGVAYGGVKHAYRTLAQMAMSEGDEKRAYAYLEAMAAVGESRGIARLVATSLAERVRLHAARKRPGQAMVVVAELATVIGRSGISDLLAPQIHLDLAMARSYAAVATGDDAVARVHLTAARELATRLNRGYEAIQVLALEALLAERGGRSPEALLTEALSRAESGGLVRVFADTLPEVVELLRRRSLQGPMSVVSRGFIDRVLAAAEVTPTSEPEPAPSGRSALLTPKESQVLHLLAGGLQNKQIATELDLSADTVKWHVKKLLAKLNAGNRDHAVDRARMLGLLR
jgi:LuxR family maltose regulon positive regulatory protein